MKKIIAGITAFTMICLGLNAQHEKERMHRHHEKRHLNQESGLNFSDDQKQQMKTLNEEFRKNMMELKKEEDITVKEWKSRMEELKARHKEDVQKLLTPEQKGEIEKMKEKRKKAAEINSKARMEKMKLHLGLSEEQSAKLTKERDEFRRKMQQIKEDKSLSDDQRKEELKSQMKKHKEATEAIFTDEQKAKLKQQKSKNKRKPARRSRFV